MKITTNDLLLQKYLYVFYSPLSNPEELHHQPILSGPYLHGSPTTMCYIYSNLYFYIFTYCNLIRRLWVVGSLSSVIRNRWMNLQTYCFSRLPLGWLSSFSYARWTSLIEHQQSSLISTQTCTYIVNLLQSGLEVVSEVHLLHYHQVAEDGLVDLLLQPAVLGVPELLLLLCLADLVWVDHQYQSVSVHKNKKELIQFLIWFLYLSVHQNEYYLESWCCEPDFGIVRVSLFSWNVLYILLDFNSSWITCIIHVLHPVSTVGFCRLLFFVCGLGEGRSVLLSIAHSRDVEIIHSKCQEKKSIVSGKLLYW